MLGRCYCGRKGKIMRILNLIICFLLVSSQLCKAQSDSLVIHFRSGAKQSIALSQIKKITFDTVKAGVKENTPNEPVISYPNPTTGETRIVFFMGSPGEVIVEISNAEGLSIWTDKQFFTKGPQSISWDGMSSLGFPAPPGSYIARIQSHNKQYINKIILLKS